ncbi:chymotrypsin-1-like [Halictus rubicundus]|uniref:chymotrypsin-1-like n=1 Tax=Halictus rubicundus TaxID=77578 RepID=UPI0040351B77
MGPDDSQLGWFPYVVSLRSNNEHICGGAIIDPTHILTAAHCLLNYLNNPSQMVAITSTIFLNQGGETHRVSAVYITPNFHTDDEADVGMVKQSIVDISIFVDNSTNSHISSLSLTITVVTAADPLKLYDPITYNAYQKPISLSTDRPPESGHGLLVGWGQVPAEGGRLSNIQQYQYIEILNNSKCQMFYTQERGQHICTSTAQSYGVCGSTT